MTSKLAKNSYHSDDDPGLLNHRLLRAPEHGIKQKRKKNSLHPQQNTYLTGA